MPTTTSTTTLTCTDGFAMPAYLARPDHDEPVPGVVFMFEAFGMTDEMRRIADELAAKGFAVILPDLLARGSWIGCIRKVFADFRRGDGQTFRDLETARGWLAAQPFVAPGRMAVMGLCIGGGFALILARRGQYQVAAPFYGQVPADLTGACPVVGSYGGRDRMLAPHAARLEHDLERLGVPHDVKVYPSAGHSFMNRPSNRVAGSLMGLMGAGYDPAAAADATERVAAFLTAHV